MEAYRQGPLTIAPEDLPDLGFRWPKYILSWPASSLRGHHPFVPPPWLCLVGPL